MVAVLKDVASFTFLERFMGTNTPCLVRGGGLKLPVEWVDTDGINWMHLKTNFGVLLVFYKIQLLCFLTCRYAYSRTSLLRPQLYESV